MRQLRWSLFVLLAIGCGDTPTAIVDARIVDGGADGVVATDAAVDGVDIDAAIDGPDIDAAIDAAIDGPDIDAAIDAVIDGPDIDAEVDAPACVANLPCATNPGAPCLTGVTACPTALVAGAEACVDSAPAPDGTTCAAGLCALGTCAPPTTVTGAIDLSTTSTVAGRTCADAPSYGVAAIAGATITLAAPVVGDCFAIDDEALLINLQGAPAATANVGAWELVRIASVAGTDVTLAAPPVRHYGASVGADDAIGAGAGQQKVALIRVPRYGALSIGAGAAVTAAPWNGTSGGVLALRAAALTVDGSITMRTAGYRSGRWSRDGGCNSNVVTEAGESFTGPAVPSVAANGGGGGGISALGGVSFNGNTPLSSTAGHASTGLMGSNGLGRTIGPPGASYGANDATRLTLGSGPGGNLTCITGGGAAVLIPAPATTSGGIIVLIADRLTVGAAGQISAAATNSARDVAASGGTVLVRGTTIDLGLNRVSAAGAIATSGVGSGPMAGMTLAASPGYVIVQAPTATGTTVPPASRP